MKVAVGAAEENLKRVKSNFAEKIAKVKKRYVNNPLWYARPSDPIH